MPSISPQLLQIINQLFDMEKKIELMANNSSLKRNVRRMKSSFQDMGYEYHAPIGEKYDETRTDCEATISGNSTKNLRIVEVIKPIITIKEGNHQLIVQKGVVIVEGR